MISTDAPEKFLKFSFIIILIGFSVALLICFGGRAFYPFELEWMEGDMLCAAIRLTEGKAIYIDPAGDFVPFLYPPFYYWLISLFIPLFGPHFWIGRLISIASFFAICFFIYRIVYRLTADRLISSISLLLLPASYKLTGYWFDVVRTDSLYLALSLGGLYFLDKNIKKAGFWISAVFFIIAFFSKQTSVFFITAAILILWQEEHRRAFYFSFLLMAIIGVVLFMLQFSSNGWYWFYIFKAGTRQKTDLIRGFGEGLVYILRHLPIVCGVILYSFFRKTNKIKNTGRWFLVFMFAFIAMALPYGKAGGYINNFYPVIVCLCILFGISLRQILEYKKKSHYFFRNLIWVILILQTPFFVYNPTRYIPKESDVKAGENFIEEVSMINGEVYIPEHGFYGVMAGKKMLPKQSALDMKFAFPKMEISKDVKNKISHQKFVAIYTDRLLEGNKITDEIDRRIVDNYQIEKMLKYSPENAFEQFTGYRSRPNVKYVPKPRLNNREP